MIFGGTFYITGPIKVNKCLNIINNKKNKKKTKPEDLSLPKMIIPLKCCKMSSISLSAPPLWLYHVCADHIPCVVVIGAVLSVEVLYPHM